jgi:hypothetical protein
MNQRTQMKTTQREPRQSSGAAANRYIDSFKRWVDEHVQPHAFVTMNLPNARRAPREESFYLTFWTRAAEEQLLGARSLKVNDFERSFLWLLRREVSADNLIHYHAVVRFPLRTTWRNEPAPFSIATRCARLHAALLRAASRTPEPFSPLAATAPRLPDFDVRPYERARNHAGYLLKEMHRLEERDFFASDVLRDSGLIVLPHLRHRSTQAPPPAN